MVVTAPEPMLEQTISSSSRLESGRYMFVVDDRLASCAGQVQWRVQRAGARWGCVRVELIGQHLCPERDDGRALLPTRIFQGSLWLVRIIRPRLLNVSLRGGVQAAREVARVRTAALMAAFVTSRGAGGAASGPDAVSGTGAVSMQSRRLCMFPPSSR